MENLPLIVDNWNPNDTIKQLRDVLASNSYVRYDDLMYALNKPLQDQNWFYNILYSSGLYPIFKIFNVPATEMVSIKALVDYNYNPSLYNLYNLLENVIPTDTDYLIDQGQGWVTITVASLNIDNYTYPVTTENPFTNIITQNLPQVDLLEIPSVDFSFNYQNKYILTVYIPCGVLLNIILTTPAIFSKIKKDTNKIRKDIKKITKYYNNLIFKGENNGRRKNIGFAGNN